MKLALCLLLLPSLWSLSPSTAPPLARADEPKQFLVVSGDGGQVVVDLAAWCPDCTDAVRTIETPPGKGIVSWNGARLAAMDAVPGGVERAIFVQDLLVHDGQPPFQTTGEIKALELIGWLGDRHRLVLRAREHRDGYVLKVVQARLAKDSMLENPFDVTPTPGVYKFATPTRRGELAWFAVRGNDRGQVLVWKDGTTRVIAADVAASSLCWSPDGASLAVAELGKLSLYDVAKAERRATFDLPPGCKGAPARIGAMAWRPDGASIALLPDWPEPGHRPNNPRVWAFDANDGTCSVLVELVTAARRVRWLDGTGCDTSLEEACELAARPVVGSRP